MTIRAITTAAATFLLASGCLLAAAGCSSNSASVPVTATTPVATTSAAATSAATAAATSASAASSTARPPSDASPPNTTATAGAAICSTLTPDDVQYFLADPAQGPTLEDLGTGNGGQRCIFNNADEDQTVEVDVVATSDPVLGFAAAKAQEPNAVPVAGVGDQAFRAPDDYTPTAEGSGITCFVTASIDQIPAASAMIVDGHSITLTAPQQDAVATALGTICNRLFGSGSTTPDLSMLPH